MDINEKIDKLINKECSVYDLDCNDIDIIKTNVKKKILVKKSELNTINKKIKGIKVKIDNWNK